MKASRVAEAPVVEMRIADVAVDPATDLPMVLLRSESGDAFFAISVGALEAKAISCELSRTRLERPLAHDLINDILTTLGERIERVEIGRCDRHEHSAKLCLVGAEGKQHSVAARPSDAIAVAIRAGAPIFVCMSLVEHVGADDSAKWRM